MTREEFIEILEKNKFFASDGEKYRIPYKIEEDKIVVMGDRPVDLWGIQEIPSAIKFINKGYLDLESITSLPPGVEFKNGGDVYLKSLKTLPPGAEFNNEKGDVHLQALKTLPPGVVFNNEKRVYLESITSISIGVKFMNGGDVYLKLINQGSFFSDWNGNIKGIDSKMLLNGMIKRGVFI